VFRAHADRLSYQTTAASNHRDLLTGGTASGRPSPGGPSCLTQDCGSGLVRVIPPSLRCWIRQSTPASRRLRRLLPPPQELRSEAEEADLTIVSLESIQGAGAYVPDLEERENVPTARDAILCVARRCADVPEMLGVGAHLLLIASRSAG
jgi:hypothetical protein